MRTLPILLHALVAPDGTYPDPWQSKSSIQFWILISTVPLRPRDLENRGMSTGKYKDHASYLRQLKLLSRNEEREHDG
jgi:hypothetical protein